MSKKDWDSIKNSYEIYWASRTLAFEKMPWLIQQIIESKYAEMFFPSTSHTSLHINLSTYWDHNYNMPKIVVAPQRNWVTFRYYRVDKSDPCKFDWYKITIDQITQLKTTLFKLLERLEKR